MGKTIEDCTSVGANIKDMKNIHIEIAVFNNGTIHCSQRTLLNNLLEGIIFPKKVDYTVHYNGPNDIPWGVRDERGLSALREEITDIPTTQGEWVGKYISAWIEM